MQEPSVQEANPVNYKDTLNLPQTAFKMKAGAATREVEIESHWAAHRVYEAQLASADKTKKFVLHDGPPYLSSDKIHIGTALNKILKDIVTRYKSQQGLYTPYVPGYDGHGLPIENAVVKNIKGGRHAISEVELRKRCREFALANLKGQEANFKRLGIWGDWANPYITIDAEFEATQIQVFGKMYQKGYVYKGLKPVYWCPSCETALADAEVEYGDHISHSIYVKFPITKIPGVGKGEESIAVEEMPKRVPLLEGASFVIWTTTPWTLPANLALAIHPAFVYAVVETAAFGKLIVAEDLLESFAAQVGLEMADVHMLGKFCGEELSLIETQHPFIDRKSPVLLGEHVTLDAGTGVVHTAPGHGMEDYLVVQEYNRKEKAFQENPIPILSPLDNAGKFTSEAQVAELQGVFYAKGNEIVLGILQDRGVLLKSSKFSHSYPHCWRCQNPVIYRATEQWFIDINQFRAKALTAIDTVEWLPVRGRNRIYSMVEGRGDWCLSRQRVWGVPIPIFYYQDTREVLITPEIIEHLYQLFKVHSSDIWWEQSAEELLAGLPDNLKQQYGVGARPLEKEMDIMDVWFDSGISHTAVVKARESELGDLPVELYLEGSDQHRGWFQSSLLTSVMLYDKAPYKSVLTHGFVLDESGRKMSKSLGNVVDPNSVIREYGADVLRLWVASVDYTNDARIGKSKLYEMAEIYKKVRNTVRFILGNLYDFNPTQDRVPYERMSNLDRYTLHRLHHILSNITDAFEKWEFYRYCHEIQWLCMQDLSSLYFDVTKDILYCDAPNSQRRRAVQTVLYEILSVVLPVLVPVTPHLAEDIWLSLPENQRMEVNGQSPVSATLLSWPEINKEYQRLAFAESSSKSLLLLGSLTPIEEQSLKTMMAISIQDVVNDALEHLRSDGKIGKSLQSDIILQPLDPAIQKALGQFTPDELALLFGTSVNIEVRDKDYTGSLFPDDYWAQNYRTATKVGIITVYAAPSRLASCARCWKYEPTVGKMPGHALICQRCAEAVTQA